MSRRTFCLATFTVIYTAAVLVAGLLVAGLVGHLAYGSADPQSGYVFLGVAVVLMVVAAWPGLRMLERLEQEWDRRDAEDAARAEEQR